MEALSRYILLNHGHKQQMVLLLSMLSGQHYGQDMGAWIALFASAIRAEFFALLLFYHFFLSSLRWHLQVDSDL